MDYLLSLHNIYKSFGVVKALKGVSLHVKKGEVHALIGENGAGKSTLMKVISGAHQADSGQMFFNGQTYLPKNPLDSRKLGIAMIYQELTLAPHLTVEENIMLGIEPTQFGFVKNNQEKVRQALSLLGQGFSPTTKVRELSIGKQQLVEIARALVAEAQIIIMDEPTSSLSSEDTQALFKVIQTLKKQGIAIIYISHFLEEVKEISDSFTVLRDGETISSGSMQEITIPEIIKQMVGRSVDELYPNILHTIGETVLEVNRLGNGISPKSVSFKLRKGEILGLAGLIGAGRSETIRAIFGLEKVKNGEVKIKEYPHIKAHYLYPQTTLDKGINLLSENRKEEGLALNLSIATNLTLSALKKYTKLGFLNLKEESQNAKNWADKLGSKYQSIDQAISGLSGGNQQKICLARLLHHESEILFLDEPTRGIDVGSKSEIYRLIQQLAGQGKAIVMISSYLPELLGVCDTLAVMHRGEMSPIREVEQWTEDAIMLYATSGRYNF
ncbi:sugar ABC transporter ATP-binding protein [Thermoflexibacter ruber]|uniref:Monosaccharide ABC transporter ATP-binding protein, CUT2 family n=1 Tax=Thermoflexibacter ruber TaxID=1003 RepID=A0A1I2I1D2_9BACT|nr:sugar ABC transporter ATP-binding protein [Thermoflexibacter ruber]SFF36199.1 monosaccharide ABC transporter ATP-binding protein, CUT2 family [Thermoflexibacter ruber]